MTDPTPAPAAQPAPAAPLSESDDKLWASLAHFGGLLYIVPSLLIYVILKGRGPKVTEESKKALNWQITFLIIWVVWIIIFFILNAVLIASFSYGLFFLPNLLGFLIWAVNALLSILAGVKVQQGGAGKYPFSFHFIK